VCSLTLPSGCNACSMNRVYETYFICRYQILVPLVIVIDYFGNESRTSKASRASHSCSYIAYGVQLADSIVAVTPISRDPRLTSLILVQQARVKRMLLFDGQTIVEEA